MQFRDLKAQYDYLKNDIDRNIQDVINRGVFIGGDYVNELEKMLAEYVGVKHCISCANGTDALQLALMAWNVGEGDAVFVPDFTFFSTGEVVSTVGATPVFVDVDAETYNISCDALENMINRIVEQGKLTPKVIIAVDLFGQPADYNRIYEIAKKYEMCVLEDGAQGFGGRIGKKMACSFGEISTTSFFPAKPLGCYGDGGAVFTDNDNWADFIRSLKVHGKGKNKYDNIRIGMNSRLDSIQAAILTAKLPIFKNEELHKMQDVAEVYTEKLKNVVTTPSVREKYYSSWAQYTVQFESPSQREKVMRALTANGIPSMVYYQKPMHKQEAFKNLVFEDRDYSVTNQLCETVLSLPIHPYMKKKEVELVADTIINCLQKGTE